jgi:hypothetical protein
MSETRDIFSGTEDVFNVMNAKLTPTTCRIRMNADRHR